MALTVVVQTLRHRTGSGDSFMGYQLHTYTLYVRIVRTGHFQLGIQSTGLESAAAADYLDRTDISLLSLSFRIWACGYGSGLYLAPAASVCIEGPLRAV